MKSHEEIKNNILEQMQKIKEEKLLKKNEIKRGRKKDLVKHEKKEEERFINHQERYRNNKKEDGIYQVQSFLHSSQIEQIDNYIAEKAKERIKLNRSKVIAKAIENFFQNNNNGDTPNE